MILFNSHTTGYQWLSNFWLAPIVTAKLGTWPSVEHLYQAAKTLDTEAQERVRCAQQARDAKRLGKHVELRPDWLQIRDEVMRRALRLKFEQHADLQQNLLATGEEDLAHLSPWDTYWGIGNDLEGKNVLGEMLMKLRADLKEA